MEEFKLFKLVILGSGAAGKSAVAFRYVFNEFVEKHNATIEDGYRFVDTNASVVLDIVDTGDQEEFRQMQDTWIRNGEGFFLIYDITNHQTFDEVKQIHSKIRRVKPDTPILLAGNKADLPNESRQVAKAEGEALAKIWGCPFLETSAKNSSNVQAAFEDLTRLMIKERETKPPTKKEISVFQKKSVHLERAETVDLQTSKNIVEESVNIEKLEREKKKEDEAKCQRQLDERRTTAKCIEQKEIEEENEQMIRKREELACITNQRDNSKECLKNRLIELRRRRKGHENEISSNAVWFNDTNTTTLANERVLEMYAKRNHLEMKLFLKNEPTFWDPDTGDLVTKPVAPDMILISNFMKKFEIPAVREAVSIIFIVMRELLARENRDIEAKTNQRNKSIETDFLEKERIQIQEKKSSAEHQAKDLNKKIAEYNAGARALMEAQKKNDNQIRIRREHINRMEQEYKKSLEVYREEKMYGEYIGIQE